MRIYRILRILENIRTAKSQEGSLANTYSVPFGANSHRFQVICCNMFLGDKWKQHLRRGNHRCWMWNGCNMQHVQKMNDENKGRSSFQKEGNPEGASITTTQELGFHYSAGKIDEVTFFIAPGLDIRGIQVCCAIYAPRG